MSRTTNNGNNSEPPSDSLRPAAAEINNRGSTPMLAQYLKLKAEVGDAILFYRMGDFYEMFFEDAQIAAPICDLALTSRNKSSPDPVPMAGVPWHSAEPHIARLLRAGLRVAICEQVAGQSNAKLMDREIVEILSPGTTLSEGLLEDSRNNYLAVITAKQDQWALSVADLSTGEFFLAELTASELFAELERLSPKELLLPEQLRDHHLVRDFLRAQTKRFSSFVEDWYFSPSRGRKNLLEHFDVVTLEPFGIDNVDLALAAAGALITYAKEQRRSDLAHLRPPRLFCRQDAVLLDEATLVNLEILESISGGREHSLLHVLDRTKTPMGARAIRRALGRPLTCLVDIRARHDAVETLVADQSALTSLRGKMTGIGDIERIIARIHCGRAKARDLFRLRDSLQPVRGLLEIATGLNQSGSFPRSGELDPATELTSELSRALLPDLISAPKGEIIQDDYDSELSRLRDLARGGQQWLADLQERERKTTGIPTLKVSHNRVFGYYIEVTRSHLSRVPEDYERKQTLVGAERYITSELKQWEEKIFSAQEQLSIHQDQIIEQLMTLVRNHTSGLQLIAQAIAEWDLLGSFARRALEGRYCRPVIDETDRIKIVGGRHPVVEQFLDGESFVPNDVNLNTRDRQIQIITGPNMAGKSTFLRQTGLLVLMAQAGSFIPASSAEIGVTDRIFTRVGASDRISRGQSTFLVEMIETSRILHEATSRSLVLLDEIGRGTSTYDGLAIAWSVAEYLRSRNLSRPRTLFATHFHELTELARIYPGYANLNVQVKEWQDQIIFVRCVSEGTADRSYGIQVAKLAGLPDKVLQRAREILHQLVKHSPRDLLHLVDDLSEGQTELPLWQSVSKNHARWAGSEAPRIVQSVAETPSAPESISSDSGGDNPIISRQLEDIHKLLQDVELDTLSPRAALDLLYTWKASVFKEKDQ